MRKFLFLLIVITSTQTVLAQSKDSIMIESEEILLLKQIKKGTYQLLNKPDNSLYKNLKFASSLGRYIQVIDSKNNVFFFDRKGVKHDSISHPYWMCGTVPHYELRVQKNGDHFDVYEDETFYDHDNEEAAKVIHSIPTAYADSILFINGRNEFNFTSNFRLPTKTSDPRTIILVKDGKYSTLAQPDVYFDALDFSNYSHSIITEKDGLYGVLGVIPPKYASISHFNFFIAEVELPNGNQLLIDIDGNEYK